MVFNPCPQGQRSKASSTPKARDAAPLDNMAPRDPPTEPDTTPATSLSEERLAFEAIFRPSTPRRCAPFPETIPEVRQLPRPTVNRAKELRPKASRLSLSQLSHRIRKRLSRESQLSKKPSRKLKEQGVAQLEPAPENTHQNMTPNNGDDITTANDTEYDSDARDILTPQIAERIGVGVLSVSGKPKKLLSDIESVQGSLGISHDMFTTGLDGSVSERKEEPPVRETGRLSNLNSILTNGRRSVSDSSYGTNQRSPQARRPPPASNPGSLNRSQDTGELADTEDANSLRHLESPFPGFTWELKPPPKSNRRRFPPTMRIPSCPKVNTAVGSETSDGHASGVDLQTPQLKCARGAAGLSRRAQVSSESFVLRSREQIKSLRRSLSAAGQSSSTGQHSDKSHARSRFIEGFDDVSSNNSSDPILRFKNTDQRDTRRSVSDGWLSDGKRQGYGYCFVTEADQNPPSDSERENAKTQVGKGAECDTDQLPSGKESRSADSASAGSSQLGSESTAVSEQPYTHNKLGSQDDLSYGASVSKLESMEKQKDKCVKGDKRFFSSWARFPSHTKNARNGSAGLSDNVITRDFAPEQPRNAKDMEHNTLSRVGDKQSDSGPSTRKTAKLFKHLARLHRSDGTNNRRFLRTRHLSDISRIEELKGLELDSVSGTTSERVSDYIGDMKEDAQREKENIKTGKPGETMNGHTTPPRTVGHPSPLGSNPPGLSTSDEGGLDVPTERLSAEIWSRMYDDCIGSLSDDAIGSSPSNTALSQPGSMDGREDAAVVTTDEQRPEQVSSSSTDLPNSTTEFKEEQLANEVTSRDGLLRLVEDAWGE
ncbi:hypothetical protein AJ79_07280 [Helicocarpus griseus UAMH5409]|uniref:Uncharacterized protein n=1 Tax=Helicocarpus griseus UAMH5409 TaxID=1447875 RepID=A0A2B7WWN4_9EURO|nr:hypothetical protein AJ79_07280 [Helicocarpus griseus UAMH5409]